MFRNALRQSTRAVGALSATSRLAVVSSTHHLSPPGRPDPNSIPRRPDQSQCPRPAVGELHEAFLLCRRGIGTGARWAMGTSHNYAHCFCAPLGLRLANWSVHSEMPHPLPSRPAPSLRPRPPRLRSLPSSSRESAVSRRSPTSPRPVVSSPSGTFFPEIHEGLGGGMAGTRTGANSEACVATASSWTPRVHSSNRNSEHRH